MNWHKSLKAWPICYKQRNINYQHPQPFYMLHAGILSWTLIASNILALVTQARNQGGVHGVRSHPPNRP